MIKKTLIDKRKTKDYVIEITEDKPAKSIVKIDEEFNYEDVIEDNKVVKRMSLKKIDPRENMKQFRVSDFSMENVIAAGAESTMKSCQFTDTDVDRVLSQFEK